MIFSLTAHKIRVILVISWMEWQIWIESQPYIIFGLFSAAHDVIGELVEFIVLIMQGLIL